MKNKAILLFSGGVDSTVCLYLLLKNDYQVKAVSFDYSQTHRKEIDYAESLCQSLSVEHKKIKLEGVFSNSALTGDKHIPSGHYQDEIMSKTIVPNRNLVFLSISASIAEAEGFEEIHIGCHAGDFAIYRDCRKDFVDQLNHTLSLSSEKKIKIFAPLISLNKTEVCKLGKHLGVPFKKTWTCYRGEKEPCGKCGACRERREAICTL